MDRVKAIRLTRKRVALALSRSICISMYVCVYACSLLLVTVVMVTEEESERNFLYIEEKRLVVRNVCFFSPALNHAHSIE